VVNPVGLGWVDFGWDNIHSGPICYEQAGTVFNCYSTSCTITAEIFLGGLGGVDGMVQAIM
jgi:hypothetical protein